MDTSAKKPSTTIPSKKSSKSSTNNSQHGIDDPDYIPHDESPKKSTTAKTSSHQTQNQLPNEVSISLFYIENKFKTNYSKVFFLSNRSINKSPIEQVPNINHTDNNRSANLSSLNYLNTSLHFPQFNEISYYLNIYRPVIFSISFRMVKIVMVMMKWI